MKLPFSISVTSLALLAAMGISVLTGCGSPDRAGDPWSMAERIVGSISEPDIPDRVFRLTDYGGTGDGITDNREAFVRAFSACSQEGGGRLVVGPGDYLVNGPLHLASHLELHLEKGARIFFGSDPEDYLPVVLTSWEGTRCYNYSPFIYAF